MQPMFYRTDILNMNLPQGGMVSCILLRLVGWAGSIYLGTS